MAALLLLIPRFATLGALIALGALGNVLMLNFGYDVPVKLATIHWLLMAGFILAPDLRGLTNFFVLHRSAQEVSAPPLFRRRWLEITAIALQLAFGLLFMGFKLYRQQHAMDVERDRKSAPLYGIWLVNSFKIDGKPDSVVADTLAWRRMVVSSSTDGMIESTSGPDRQVLVHFDAPK